MKLTGLRTWPASASLVELWLAASVYLNYSAIIFSIEHLPVDLNADYHAVRRLEDKSHVTC